jgi:SAM-dependent methyltransferase
MTAPPPPRFDRLAALYRPLEYLAFGRDLERARLAHLEHLADCRDILVLGEGDGRFLARLVQAAPAARIRCVDASAAMLARAAGRLAGTAAPARVTFECADALRLDWPPRSYDAVVTLFFLDCFPPDQVAALIARLASAVRPGALWSWADFAVPPTGWGRLKARAWLALLYAFFRWTTGLAARELPPAEDLLGRAGFRCERERAWQGGLIRSAVFRAPSPAAFSPAAGPGKG